MTQLIPLRLNDRPQIDTDVLIDLYETLGWTACDSTISELMQSLREALEVIRWTVSLGKLTAEQEASVLDTQILSILSISEVLGLTGLLGVALEALTFWANHPSQNCPARNALAARIQRVGQSHLQALEILVDMPSYGPCVDEQER